MVDRLLSVVFTFALYIPVGKVLNWIGLKITKIVREL